MISKAEALREVLVGVDDDGLHELGYRLVWVVWYTPSSSRCGERSITSGAAAVPC